MAPLFIHEVSSILQSLLTLTSQEGLTKLLTPFWHIAAEAPAKYSLSLMTLVAPAPFNAGTSNEHCSCCRVIGLHAKSTSALA